MNKIKKIDQVIAAMPPSDGPIHASWQVKGEQPGPTVTLKFYEHPQEFTESDIETIPALLAEIREKIQAGTVNIVFGNLEAPDGQRFAKQDTNRLYGKPNKDMDDPEEARVAAIQEILDETHILIDFHAVINKLEEGMDFTIIPTDTADPKETVINSPTGPIALTELIKALYLKTVVLDCADKSGYEYAQYADEYMKQNGGIGITLEDGSVQDPSFERNIAGTLNMLTSLGTISGSTLDISQEPEIYAVVQDILAHGEHFALTHRFENWEKVAKGQPIASTDDPFTDTLVTTTATHHSYALFAKAPEHIKHGQSAVLFVAKTNN